MHSNHRDSNKVCRYDIMSYPQGNPFTLLHTACIRPTSALRAYVLRRATHCQNLIVVRNSMSVPSSASELVRCTSTVTRIWPAKRMGRIGIIQSNAEGLWDMLCGLLPNNG